MGSNPEPPAAPKTTRRRARALPIVAVILAGVAIVTVWRLMDAQELLRTALDWIGGLGVVGMAVYVGVYVLACVLFLPGSVLTLGAGALYGVVRGSLLVSVASTLGATAAFIVGRYFARSWVARKIEGNGTFTAIDEAVAGEGWKIVGLTRLSPVFPFSLLNYAFGLTKVSLRDYFLASWIGMMPGTVMYVYVGSLARDLAAMGAEERVRTPAEWSLYIVGLLATVAVTVYVTKIAKKALAQRL